MDLSSAVSLTRAVPEQMYGLQFSFPWWTGASQPHVPDIRVKTALDAQLSQ
jgi:hypothetical protein